MSELNTKQKELCNTLEGFIVVDAGPGTGKTHTIVQRYVNILNSNVNPMDVLMLTFTRNAASEMESRISLNMSDLISKGKDPHGFMANALNNLRVSTIDSFCLDVVLNSPEDVKEFFDPDDDDLMLSRGAAMVENETLNRQYFGEFYSRFIRDHGSEYNVDGVDYAAMIGGDHMDIYGILCKLMSRGIIPKKKGWFGNAKDLLVGDREEVLKKINENMADVAAKVRDDIRKDQYPPMPELLEGWKALPEELVTVAAYNSRETLIKLIHDIYYGYIVQCIKDNRLTFGLCELFAFIILLNNRKTRNLHSVEYLTIDEFQDTNELQMKICLLLMKKPNMCVVGDWKQGIFGFRYVSIDNITQFGERIGTFMEELEDTGIDFPFRPKLPVPIEFDSNYRSSKLILEKGFQALDIKGNENETVSNGKIVPLQPMMQDIYGRNTGFKCIQSETKDDEVRMAVDLITEYVFSGRYKVVEEKDKKPVEREMGFGDIAVLCRSTDNCTRVYQECQRRGIPAYLQGDLEVMLTREGKLVLAWLRFLNDPKDDRGISAILADRGYPLSEIERMRDSKWSDIPIDIENAFNKLKTKKRRLNDLITSIFRVCDLNNGVVQTIINVLSSAHEDSLMTISDLIRLIEDDIKAETTYNVEPLLDEKAVTIQTAHKSKGLEYPAVIIVGLDQGSFPSTSSDDGTLIFDDTIGLRCTRQYVSNDDGEMHEMVIKSWETSVVKAAFPRCYDEERRLLFVAMTRAKQYLALTAYNPSAFFKHFSEQCGTVVPEAFDAKIEQTKKKATAPAIGDYSKKRTSLSVHDLMSVIKENEGIVKREGRGKEYGEMVHEKAYLYLKRGIDDPSVPEMEYIRKIIEDRRDAKLSAEIKCVLPVDDVSIKGTIDLIAEYDDRIEIHDYKTDMDHCFLNQYRLQLSIYALAAQSIGKKVECFIDFVALNETVPVEPDTMEFVRECIAEYRRRLQERPALS